MSSAAEIAALLVKRRASLDRIYAPTSGTYLASTDYAAVALIGTVRSPVSERLVAGNQVQAAGFSAGIALARPLLVDLQHQR